MCKHCRLIRLKTVSAGAPSCFPFWTLFRKLIGPILENKKKRKKGLKKAAEAMRKGYSLRLFGILPVQGFLASYTASSSCSINMHQNSNVCLFWNWEWISTTLSCLTGGCSLVYRFISCSPLLVISQCPNKSLFAEVRPNAGGGGGGHGDPVNWAIRWWVCGRAYVIIFMNSPRRF